MTAWRQLSHRKQALLIAGAALVALLIGRGLRSGTGSETTPPERGPIAVALSASAMETQALELQEKGDYARAESLFRGRSRPGEVPAPLRLPSLMVAPAE